MQGMFQDSDTTIQNKTVVGSPQKFAYHY